MSVNEFNFVHEKVEQFDVDLFDMDGSTHFNDDHTLAHIMHLAGIFPSVSQARKNGWHKPIPFGFSEFVVGKSKKQVFILNKIET